MQKSKILQELEMCSAHFGEFPYDFFRLLKPNSNDAFDFDKENDNWSSVKEEDWHSLRLADYFLWATTDNADLLWWNGHNVISLSPRPMEYASLRMSAYQFLQSISVGLTLHTYPNLVRR